MTKFIQPVLLFLSPVMWIKNKPTFTFTCSQTQSEKRAVLSKASMTFISLVNWQIMLCLSPLPIPSSIVSTQLWLDCIGEFQFYWKQWQSSYFIQSRQVLVSCCSSLPQQGPAFSKQFYSWKHKIQASFPTLYFLPGWPSPLRFFPPQMGEYCPLCYIPVWYTERYTSDFLLLWLLLLLER